MNYLEPILAALGVVAGAGISWGFMKKTVEMLQSELGELRKVIPDFAALKFQVAETAAELGRFREIVDQMKDSIAELRTEVQVNAARTLRKRIYK